MFFIDTLLDIAIEADATYKSATDPDIRREAYFRKEQAMMCSQWMQDNNILSMPIIGPFGDHPQYKRGDKVRIKKGAHIFSMHPKKSRYQAGTTHTVTVFDMHKGTVYPGTRRSNEIILHQPRVMWAGTGGYWCETGVENVELVT